MQLSFPAPALFAVAALVAASPATAQSTATSTLADFQISLVDLDPSDGVAPTLTLDPQSRSTVAPGVVSADGRTTWIQQGDSAFGAVSSSGQLDDTGASASFAGDPLGAGATIAASAVGGPSLAIGSSAAYIETQPTLQNLFTLGAHTEVTFAGIVTLGWNASNPAGAAFGEADMALYKASGDSEDLAMGYVTGGYYGDGAGALSGSTAGLLTVTLDNDSDGPIDVGYEVDVFANASELETVLSPVDEPAGASMLLAGAAVLLRRLRWRQVPRH